MNDPDEAPGLIGHTLGQYKIVEKIGHGGMATIFKAHQPAIDRYVAVKVLPVQFAHTPNFVQRFQREARAIAALEHPHILPIYDFGTQQGVSYMVMRYIRGGDLANLMARQLSNERVVEIISKTARALNYAHEQGVIHRDIKPSNILLDENGEPLLTDFGIAKTGDSKLTGTGMVLGTPDYMAPEQVQGITDSRSDIYSLGVILYELLTGQPPYQAATPLATAFKHVSETLPAPRSINPNIEPPLERVVLTALAKDPDQRYQSGNELAQALQEALDQIASSNRVTLNRPVTPTHLREYKRIAAPVSKSTWPIWAGLVLLLLVGLGAFAFLSRSDTSNSASSELPTVVEAVEPSPTSALAGLLAGDLIVKDSFDSNGRQWDELEYRDEFGYYQARLVNGRYRLTHQAEQVVLVPELPALSSDFDNFITVVEADPADESDPFGFGFIFRASDRGAFYTFEVYTAGYFRVRINAGSSWQTLIEDTPTNALAAVGPNRLAVQANGSEFQFFINDRQVAAMQDDWLASGKVGLLISLEEKGSAIVDYDNLVIRQLSLN